MSVVRTFRKAAVEKRRLYIDYDCWLPVGEALNSFQALITPLTSAAPLTISLAYVDAANRKLAMFAAGGVGNTSYIVQIVVSTDANQVKRDDIGIWVTP